MHILTNLTGLEILDSRGRPTVQASCKLLDGSEATVSVPSGASTGAAEAHEMRDGDPKRHKGLGCQKAAANISGEIRDAVAGKAFETQAELDRFLIELDGTPNKERLGANAILAVSLVFARAVAQSKGIPLYQNFADILADQEMGPHAQLHSLPRPTINLFSGGKRLGVRDLGKIAPYRVLHLPERAVTRLHHLDQSFGLE